MQSRFAPRITFIRSVVLLQLGFAACLSLLALGCGLEKPKSPRWTVDLLIPIANRHIDGPYLAAHAGSEYLRWQNDSGLVWNIAAPLGTVHIGDNLVARPPNAAGSFPLGSIQVGAGTTLSCVFALEEVTPLSAGTVPDMSAELNAALAQPTVFDSVAGADGLLHLEIENELGVAVDQTTVTVNAGTDVPVAILTFDGVIASGTRQSIDQSLSNLSVGNEWSATVAFHTPGGTVLSASDKFLAVRASFPQGLDVAFARAEIEAISRQYSDALVLSETHELSDAVIADGELLLAWTNSTPLPVNVAWIIPELTDGESPFSGQATFPPNTSAEMPISLAGLRYTSAGGLSSAVVNVNVQSIGSSGQTVEISAAQTVAYILSSSDLRLSSATGKVAATEITAGPLSASIDWDDGLEEAGLDSYDAFLTLTSSLPLSAQIDGAVTSNTGLDLTISGQIPSANDSPVTVRLPIAHTKALLRPLPGELSFVGRISMNGSDGTVEISSTDSVQASLELNAPPHIYVDDVSLNIEPSSVALSSDDFGDRTGRLLDASVTVTVTNRFPLGGQFTLRVARDSAGVIGSEALVFGPSTLSPAVTDDNGNAVTARTTELTYTLDRAGISLFEGEAVWFAESLTLLGPGQGQPARISSADVLDWRAQARMEVKLDGDIRPWEE